MSDPADQQSQPETAQTVQRAEPTQTQPNPTREPVRDPEAYYGAQLEKMQRLLDKQQQQREQERRAFLTRLHKQTVEGVLAAAPQDEDLREFARDYVSRAVQIDPESLEVDTTKATAFVSKLAQLAAPAPTPAAEPTKTEPAGVITTPPSADLAPERPKDWRDRIYANAAKVLEPGQG